MRILFQGSDVGELKPDGSIESTLPALRELNEYWQKEGIFAYGGPLPDQVEGTITEAAFDYDYSACLNTANLNSEHMAKKVTPYNSAGSFKNSFVDL